MQNFKFLASQEVLHLLQVLDVSFKEAKRTVLTPERMTMKDKSSLIILLGLKEAVCKISNTKLVRKYSISSKSLLCLLRKLGGRS